MEMITSIDFAILDAIQQIRCAFLDYVMAFFTYLGEAGVIWIVTGVVLLFFKKTRATGAMLLGALALSFVVGNYVVSGMLVSALSFAGALCVLYKLVLMDYGAAAARRGIAGRAPPRGAPAPSSGRIPRGRARRVSRTVLDSGRRDPGNFFQNPLDTSAGRRYN